RHGGEDFPSVCRGIVFPCIVDWYPRRWTGFWKHESAKSIYLVTVGGERDMMGRKRHRLFLRPLVCRWIIFINHADRFPDRSEPSEDVHLAPGHCSGYLLGAVRIRRQLLPLALGIEVGCRQQGDGDYQSVQTRWIGQPNHRSLSETRRNDCMFARPTAWRTDSAAQQLLPDHLDCKLDLA